MVLSVAAFAGNTNGNMSLISAGKLNGTQLNSGAYKVTWTGEGNNVQVTIKGQGVNITAPAAVVTSDKTAEHDAVVKAADGSIQEVQFGGKKTVLKFTGAPETSVGK
jgi:hypothetical protein